MVWIFKKKKPKAKLEMPPPPDRGGVGEIPEPAEVELSGAGSGNIEIPDKFHEIKFPVEDIKEEPGKPEEIKFEPEPKVEEKLEVAQELEDEFKPVSAVAKPDIPEMPELPEIPALEMEEPELIKPVMPQGPVFIKSNDFQDVLAKISQIKQNIQQTEDIFNKLNDIKNEKDKIFGQWKESQEDVQRKLLYIEKALYEV
ncbi:MAG: hypothetical protein U9R34_07100 [Nanoarchaeota archaeon]|nr:hypothetical protein [Nanoarchaeota archaeon]